jgi:hypothetical protein
MIQLDPSHYHKVLKPAQGVTFNNLFALSVIEKKMSGQIYTDNPDNPKIFYIVHPYGMSLLLGNPNNKAFNESFRDYALNFHRNRDRHEWMQAFPNEWNGILHDLFGNQMITSADNVGADTKKIELNTRINFRFNPGKYRQPERDSIPANVRIVRTDKKIYSDMKGVVVPTSFWNSPEDFYGNGVGFSLFYEDKLASTAYSAFIHGQKLELGIETVEAFRGKGFALLTSSALINYCLKNNYEPIWSCRLENTGSYRLACKLGFEPVREIPFYRLSN